MRTLAELRMIKAVSCILVAVQVCRAEAVSILQKGGAVRGSQLTPDGRGIQWIEFEGQLYHWLGGRWSEDQIDDFPDPVMAGEEMIKEAKRRQLQLVRC